MDAHIIVGSAILVLALVSGVFLAAILLAASNVSEQFSSRPLYGPGVRGAFLRPRTAPSAASRPAQCYYECMNGFHWSAEWGNLCGEACGTTTRLPRG